MVQDEANDPPRRAKMLAEKSLRRGTSDLQGLSAANMYEMNEQGVLEPIDYAQDPERAQPDAVDEISLRHRPHLFGQGRCSTIRS